MVKITAELIQRSPVVFNPLGDRELILRGLKIPAIRNIGVTGDQFDSIDLSDNDIQILGNFPKQYRLTSIQLNDNQISSVEGQNVADSLPNLTRLILTGNKIQRLEDLDEIAHLTTLGKFFFFVTSIVVFTYSI
jgi:U2 small nuclear ribonucleoprotein A'